MYLENCIQRKSCTATGKQWCNIENILKPAQAQSQAGDTIKTSEVMLNNIERLEENKPKKNWPPIGT